MSINTRNSKVKNNVKEKSEFRFISSVIIQKEHYTFERIYGLSIQGYLYDLKCLRAEEDKYKAGFIVNTRLMTMDISNQKDLPNEALKVSLSVASEAY